MALLTNINGKFSVDTDGAASFNRIGASTTTGFTFPSADGANGYVLKTNGSGTVSWAPDANTGTVTGSGTLNKVARWTATGSDIGDGPITFSAATAAATSTFGGSITGTTASFTRLDINASNTKLKGDLLGNADAAYDIGASGANRPRNLYLSNSINAGDITTTGVGSFGGRINGVVGGTAYNTAGLWLQGNSSTDGISIGGTGGGNKNIDTYGGALNLQETAQNGVNMWGNVGIGTSSPTSYDGESNNLVIAEGVNGTNPTPGITIACLANQAATGRGALRFADGTSGNEKYRGALEYNHSGDDMFFRTAGTIKVAIDTSGFVGIGQTSPQFNIHSGTAVAIPNSRYLNFAGTGTAEIAYSNFTKALVFSANDSAATSQPKSIGIILHNQSTTDNNFTPLLAFGAQSNSTNYSQVVAGIAAKRLETASDSNWSGGELWFWTARDGTAFEGSTAGLPATPVMVMDTSRNVGIGTTSPAKKLDIATPVSSISGSSTDEGAVLRLSSFINYENGYSGEAFIGGLEFFTNDSSGTGPRVYGAIKQRQLTYYNEQAMCFFTAPYDASALEERMRIDSSGRTIIQSGTFTAPAYTPAQGYPLHVQGTSQCFISIGRSGQTTGSQGMVIGLDTTTSYVWNRDNINISFGCGDLEKLRISPSAQSLRVQGGSTTGSNYMQFVNSAGTSQGYFGYGGASNILYIVQQVAGDIAFYTNSAVRGSISQGGTLTMGGDVVAYGSPSDKRLKENIKPIESALDKVSKLQGVTFDWKDKEKEYDQFGKPHKLQEWKNDIGFIAQDVQKVIPELVRENEDGMLSMRHQGIAPILLEAIKELKAEIEELKLNNCNCK